MDANLHSALPGCSCCHSKFRVFFGQMNLYLPIPPKQLNLKGICTVNPNINLSTLAAAIALALSSPLTQAATLTVDSALDDGTSCTLREAIDNANNDTGNGGNGCLAGSGDDLIVFDSTLSGQTIILTNGVLNLTTNLTIDGDAVGNDDVPDITLDGNANDRVFYVSSTVTNATLDALVIQNGRERFTSGGGIYNKESLTVSNSTLSGNVASAAGRSTIINNLAVFPNEGAYIDSR